MSGSPSITNNLPPGLKHLVDNLDQPSKAFTQPLPFKNNLPSGLKYTIEAPSSKLGWFSDIFSSTVAPEKTRKLIGVGGGFGLAASLFTGGLGFNFDTLLNIGAIASLFCPVLVVPVAAAYLAKGALSVAKSIGCLFSGDFGGVFSNLLNGALTAVCALPIGKLGKVKDLWNSTKSTEGFLYAATKLCYGSEAAGGTANAVQFFKGIKKDPSAAKDLIVERGTELFTRAKDTVRGTVTKGPKVGDVVKVTSPGGVTMTGKVATKSGILAA